MYAPLKAVSYAAKRVAQADEAEVWTRPLHDGYWAVGLFNRGDLDATIHFDAAMLGAKPGEQAHWTLRDLWLRKDLGKLGDDG